MVFLRYSFMFYFAASAVFLETQLYILISSTIGYHIDRLLLGTFVFNHLYECTMHYMVCTGGRMVVVQYSNWQSGHPVVTGVCAVVTSNNEWVTSSCVAKQKYVCQS